MMKRAVLLILSLFISLSASLVSRPSSAEKFTAQDPTLEQVLDRYVQALGGKVAIERINSRASKGTFTSTQLKTKGSVELYAKAPNKQLMVIAAQGYGDYRRGFDGTIVWEKYSGDGNAGNLSGFSKRDAEFYLPIKFRETYPRVALKGHEKLREHEVFVLEAPAAGNPRLWYFDAETGLLLRTETRNAQGKVLGLTDYDDYRGVDGVKEPFSIRLLDDDGTDFNIQLSEVRHNVQLSDESFDKPSKQSSSGASGNPPGARPEVRFTSGNSAKIPFEYTDDDNEILKVRVNGSEPMNFTVDTGSDVFAIITGRRARELGLTAHNNYKVGVAQVGEVEAASIPSANLALPGVEALNQPIEVLITDISAESDGTTIDGVLGFEFLKKFVVEIDYQAKTISLFSSDKYQYSGHGDIIPIRIHDGSPEVRVKLTTASGKIVEDYFEIDTGLSGTILFRTAAVQRYGLLQEMKTIQAPTSIEAGAEFNRRIGRARSLQLGRFILENPLVSLAEKVAGDGGLIGEEILRRFKVIFDFSHHRMILEPNLHLKDADEEDMSGIALTPEKNGGTKLFRIRQVVPNTPAAEAGMQAGDLITMIDDKPAASFTAGSIERMFKQEGRKLTLTIKRNEKVTQVMLMLHRLI
jgi:predicted aspartyl protease